jgi:hypothetical protein
MEAQFGALLLRQQAPSTEQLAETTMYRFELFACSQLERQFGGSFPIDLDLLFIRACP